MKKLLYVIFISVLLLCLSACNETNFKENEGSVYINQTSEINHTDKENNEKTNTQGSGAENLQTPKIIINPDINTAKISFRNSNDNITNSEKRYSINKNSQYEDYIDKKLTERTVSFLGKEYKDIPYYQSRKNQYKARDYDILKNEDIEIHVAKSGEITYFSTRTAINMFPDENKNSVELAKKYLNAVFPDFKYDEVNETAMNYTELYWYDFRKYANGIPTSESVSICLNSKGELNSYMSYDVGMYDNIEIKGINKDDYLQKADEYIKNTYGDIITDYTIGQNGPFYEIYNNNKLELSIPIEVNAVTSQGYAFTVGEYIVFELN